MSFRSSRISMLLVATLLPIVVIASVLVLHEVHHERQHLRSDLSARVDNAVELLDQVLSTDLAVLQALATSEHLDQGDIAAFRDQAKRIQASKPLWHTVILTTPLKQNILNLRQSPSALPLPIVDEESLIFALEARKPIIGGISAPGNDAQLRLVPLRVPVVRSDDVLYVLTTVLYPSGVAEFVRKAIPVEWLGVVVDRSGHVVSRTHEAEKYIGALAPAEARKAIATGATSGIYRARALSGENVTVIYRVSPLSGWSVHFAVPDQAFNPGFSGSILLALLGGALSVSLGAALVWLLRREMVIQRRNEEAVQHSRKMEAIGQLTGGIVHDFSNVLQVMNGSIDLMLLSAHDQSTKKSLELATIAGERGKGLLRRLKGLTRQEPGKAQPVCLVRHFANTKDLLDHLLGGKISKIIDLPSNTWPIEVDLEEFDIALMNAATNARDAMPNGGRFKITATNVTLSSYRDELAPHLRGDYVHLRLCDSGSGMSAETKERAFEPFFTTKPHYKGTGLGLSQIYTFAVQSGGIAALESKEDVGTAVHLFLPRTYAKVEQSPAPPNGTTVPRKQSAHVLVVEDEELVSKTAVAVLGALGYRATVVSSSQKALEVLEQGEIFDVVFSDIVMPGGMDGLQLSEELHKRYPGFPVLLVTGYSASLDVAPRGSKRRVIRKPYNVKSLGEAIEGLLDETTIDAT